MIEINIASDAVIQALQAAQARSSNLEPAFKSIGEMLVSSTHQRFKDKKDPDGTAWEENSAVTQALKGNARQLEGESKQLAKQIFYAASKTGVAWGSPIEYAAMQNFGGKKSAHPNLWGDIPAREFLGLSATDEDRVLEILTDFLSS